jgi:hypothetical protein
LSYERQFCTGGCDERTSVREAVDSVFVEAVARKRLVKIVID